MNHRNSVEIINRKMPVPIYILKHIIGKEMIKQGDFIMRILKCTVTLLLLLILSSSCYAANWECIGNETNAQGRIFVYDYVDTDSMWASPEKNGKPCGAITKRYFVDRNTDVVQTVTFTYSADKLHATWSDAKYYNHSTGELIKSQKGMIEARQISFNNCWAEMWAFIMENFVD